MEEFLLPFCNAIAVPPTQLILVSLLCLHLFAGQAFAEPAVGNVLFQLDFTQIRGDARQWLKARGFQLKKDMASGADIQLSGSKEKGLVITVNRSAFGFAVVDGLNLDQVGQVAIEWSVDIFPQGASWQKGIHREPVMVNLFFGSPVQVDHFFLPYCPRFIGLFLNKNDAVRVPFIGRNYQQTGRYCCLCTPPVGRMVSSIFSVPVHYRSWFSSPSLPALTGIGIETDTSGLEVGQCRSFIRTITIYQQKGEGR